jgi:hypothetical protein
MHSRRAHSELEQGEERGHGARARCEQGVRTGEGQRVTEAGSVRLSMPECDGAGIAS